MGQWLLGFLWKDLKLFCIDRQAVVMSFVVPVLIASILGWLDSSASDSGTPSRIPVLLVDLDQSTVSAIVKKRLTKDEAVAIRESTRQEAALAVRSGTSVAAIIIPKGFGKDAAGAFNGGPKPEVELLSDPSKPLQDQVVEGVLLEQASGAVAAAVFGPLAGDGTAPLKVRETRAAAAQASWSGAAHDYAGFGLQGLLFFAIESAVGLARERRQGIWKRLRSAPVPPWVFVLSRGINSTLMAFAVIVLIFGVGAALFGIRVLGSITGFLLLAIATAAMAATFGLMFATVGRSETQSRAVAILVILVMLATGGAWFPMERMPPWVQSAASYMPVRWAVEGFDAMTWRGEATSDALRPAGVLLLFALAFGTSAVLRFRYSQEPAS
jgi:ABC-2 type transport system permease protein